MTREREKRVRAIGEVGKRGGASRGDSARASDSVSMGSVGASSAIERSRDTATSAV